MPTYPLPLPNLQFTIDRVDRINELIAGSLGVSSVLGSQVDTCDFTIKAAETWRQTPGSKPQVGQVVEVSTAEDSGAFTKIFGGTIARVSEVRIAFKTVSWDCNCVDYTSLLQRIFVNKTYIQKTVNEIALDVVRNFAPFVSTSGIQAAPDGLSPSLTTATVIDRITYTRRYPAEVLDELARLVGYEWWVSPDKVVYFRDPTTAVQVSPNTITDTSKNFNELVIEPQTDQVRNRIFIQGGSALSDTIIEQYDGNGNSVTFNLRHGNVVADLSPLASGLLGSPFMSVNGVPQVVGVEGIANEDDVEAQAGFMLNVVNGSVRNAGLSPVVGDGAEILFRYQYRVPIAVVREDEDSQLTLADIEGTTYSGQIFADRPLYYWRFDRASITGNTVANLGTAGPSASGMLSGIYETNCAGPLPGNQGGAIRFIAGEMRGSSVAKLPTNAYTLECWAQGEGDGGDIIGQAGPSAGFVQLNQTAMRTYGYAHNLTTPTLLTATPSPLRTDFDHIVITWSGTQDLQLFVNKQLMDAGSAAALTTVGPSGMQIGNVGFASTNYFNGRIAEAAVYGYQLPYDRIAAHYDAGRYGGVREHIVVNNDATSFEQSRALGDRELVRWSSVLNDIKFTSFVSGWQVGQVVTFALTTSGIGRVFNGTGLIQDVQMRWLGAERIQYGVHCVGARFNIIDYYRSLQSSKNLVTGESAPLDLIGADTATFIVMTPIQSFSDADSEVSAPQVVQWDWASSPLPNQIEMGFWQISTRYY